MTNQVASASAIRVRAVRLEDGGGGGQPGADTLRAAAPAGEEVRFHEAGHDAEVGFGVAAIEQHRRAVDLPHRDVAPVVGRVVMDPIAGDDLLTDQCRHLRRGGLAMGAGGAQQLYPLGTGAGALELGQQRRQHGGVGHGAGEVGKDHHHPTGRPHQVAQRRARDGGAKRVPHRSCLVIQSGRIVPRHHRPLGHDHLEPVGAVGQSHPHDGPPVGFPGPGVAGGDGRARPRTAAATCSACPRRPAYRRATAGSGATRDSRGSMPSRS